METAFLLFFVLVASVPATFADAKEKDLARSDMVEIWDQRISDSHATPVEIVDAKIVQAIVGAITDSKTEWKRGSFTAPSGNLRFIFRSGSTVIAGVGLGDGFLVRTIAGGWESKKISKEIQ